MHSLCAAAVGHLGALQTLHLKQCFTSTIPAHVRSHNPTEVNSDGKKEIKERSLGVTVFYDMFARMFLWIRFVSRIVFIFVRFFQVFARKLHPGD